MYGPPPNAKSRADRFEDYDKVPNLAPVANKEEPAKPEEDKKPEPTTSKSTVAADNDSDATGLNPGGAAPPMAVPARPASSASSKGH